MSELGPEQIRHAILTAQAKGYRQVRLKLGDDRFSAVLSNGVGKDSDEDTGAESVSEAPAAPKSQVVGSPAVGYFRSLDPAIQVGDKVLEGDKVGEVVALGLANDVSARDGGEVVEVCVTDGDAVEYGQRILVLRP